MLRATSRKIKFVLKQSIERAKKRQSEDERWLSLSITARQYYLESEFEVIFCRNLTDCEDISLYKGRDVNRVLETILDFLEHLKINKNLDITVLYYLEGDIQSIVELIARKTIKVNHLKFTGEGISKQLFRGLLESKANNLRVCVQRPHAIELSDIDDDLIDLMMCSSFVTLGRININSLHLNLLLKKWKENSHLEYFLAQMESHLDKSIILEGTNSRQQSVSFVFLCFSYNTVLQISG